MTDDRTVPHETIAAMVRRIQPTWTVQDATPASDGHHDVYHLDVETGVTEPTTEAGRTRAVLKATPSENSPTCDDEARLLAILDAHTSLPVPRVRGVVDEDPDLPAPFFLSPTLPGANCSRTGLSGFSESSLRVLARSTGRHLARLHELDAVDAYGFVGVDATETLDGTRPSADLDQLSVPEPTESWPDYLAAESDRVLTALDGTRFADRRPELGAVLDARIDALSGGFEPVVARIDQSLDNVLLDPETGAVTGLLDWEFCLAATPAYDLAFVEHSLAGGHWRLLPGVPDYREPIRSGMLEGYREVGSPHVVEQFHENRECYALLAALHSMVNFEDWFDQVAADVPAREREAAAEALGEAVERRC